MSVDSPARAPGTVDFPLLAWLFLSLGAAHACAGAAGLLPGGPGALAAALDASVAAVVALGLAGHRWGPREAVAGLAPAGCVLAVALAALASGVRAVAGGEPWWGADVVLALLAPIALPGLRSFVVALVAAEVTWVAALLSGTRAWDGPGEPAASWVLLAVLSVFAAGTAVGLRWSRTWLRAEVEAAARSAGMQAVTDPLTGANNRRGLERLALPMIEHARRQGEAVHCLFIDVDEFRAVNDTLGNVRGDEVLTAVHEAVLASIRATDVVARWAGDQFVVLGPGTGTSPLEMERRMRGHIAADPPVPAEVWAGGVSIGSATLVPWDEGNLDSLLTRAEEDMHLRRSLRRQGRGRSRPDGGRGAVESAAPQTERRSNPPTTPPASPTAPGPGAS